MVSVTLQSTDITEIDGEMVGTWVPRLTSQPLGARRKVQPLTITFPAEMTEEIREAVSSGCSVVATYRDTATRGQFTAESIEII